MAEPEAQASPTHYQLLHVHPGAPLDLLTAAYWRLTGLVQATRRDKATEVALYHLTRAYQALADHASRESYDREHGLEGHSLPRVPLRRRSSWMPFSSRRQKEEVEPDITVNYYEVMRLDPAAHPAVVGEAFVVMRNYYLRLAEQGQARPELVYMLEEANEVLSDPSRRAEYDTQRKGHRHVDPGTQNAPGRTAPPSSSSSDGSALSEVSEPAPEQGRSARSGQRRGLMRGWVGRQAARKATVQSRDAESVPELGRNPQRREIAAEVTEPPAAIADSTPSAKHLESQISGARGFAAEVLEQAAPTADSQHGARHVDGEASDVQEIAPEVTEPSAAVADTQDGDTNSDGQASEPLKWLVTGSIQKLVKGGKHSVELAKVASKAMRRLVETPPTENGSGIAAQDEETVLARLFIGAATVAEGRESQKAADDPATRPPTNGPPAEGSVMPVLARLTVYSEGTNEVTFDVRTLPLTLGEGETCDIQLPGLAHSQARLLCHGGQFVMHDLTDEPKVRVQGNPASWALLRDGDSLELGPHRLTFTLPEGSS